MASKRRLAMRTKAAIDGFPKIRKISANTTTGRSTARLARAKIKAQRSGVSRGTQMSEAQRPIAIDLFAGAGGMSLGFEQAGFDVVAAVEIDPIHAAIHEFNFPHCAVLAQSVVGLTGKEIRRAARIGSAQVDVVFGGPPCQGFSMIGQRALDDPRNNLVNEFVRIVSELKANYFVFENVKGLTVGRHRKFLEEIIQAFSRVGYSVQMPWQVLNARHFGVPQDRQRLILMGARNGLEKPEYPPILTGSKSETAKLRLSQHITPTVSDALEDLPNAEDFEELWSSDQIRVAKWPSAISSYAKEMRCLTNDAWHFGYVRNWDRSVLTSSMRTEHTEISRRRFSQTAEGDVEPISRFFKLPSNGVANTLRAGTDSARGAFTSPRPIHYLHPRCVTVREMARLHGFPDWFRLHPTKWHGARQIGNAVAPPMARALGAQILRAARILASRPLAPIDLGDPALLRMGMAQAAAHFGVQSPIGKRDRKSGARKRKQSEIENRPTTN